MGLDMYLYAEQYVGNWHSSIEERAAYKEILDVTGLKSMASDDTVHHLLVRVPIAYWRKANAIHGWFVDNVANGTDDCRPVYCGRSQLRALLNLVTEALKTRDPGELQPRSGFFFGSVEVDEWYWKGLEYTKEALARILADPASEIVDFYYQASW